MARNTSLIFDFTEHRFFSNRTRIIRKYVLSLFDKNSILNNKTNFLLSVNLNKIYLPRLLLSKYRTGKALGLHTVQDFAPIPALLAFGFEWSILKVHFSVFDVLFPSPTTLFLWRVQVRTHVHYWSKWPRF